MTASGCPPGTATYAALADSAGRVPAGLPTPCWAADAVLGCRRRAGLRSRRRSKKALLASVREWAGYAWHVDGTDQLLVLSVMFVDLVEAGRWADAFDDLAQRVRIWVEH